MPDSHQPLAIDPALALLEYTSIAAGIFAADAMVKRAVLDTIYAGTIQPGHFLILIGGSVAEVEESLKAGRTSAPDTLHDYLFLPGVHPAVVRALGGGRMLKAGDALGIVETHTVPAAIQAADVGVKGAEVELLEVRLADGLHGKGLVFFTGDVADVEAALALTDAALQAHQKVRQVIVPLIHADIAALLRENTRFGVHLKWEKA